MHVGGKISPLDDIETINTELVLADLEMAEKMFSTAQKALKAGGDAKERFALLEKVKAALEKGLSVRSLSFSTEENLLLKSMNFISAKQVIYVANISEGMIGKPSAHVDAVKGYAQREGSEFTAICAKIEDEIAKLDKAEKQEFLKELGISESGLDLFAQKCYHLLGLQTFLTTGEKETRAWTIRKGDTAPQAAGPQAPAPWNTYPASCRQPSRGCTCHHQSPPHSQPARLPPQPFAPVIQSPPRQLCMDRSIPSFP